MTEIEFRTAKFYCGEALVADGDISPRSHSRQQKATFSFGRLTVWLST